MPASFRLLYDRHDPDRFGDLSFAELIKLYRHPSGPNGHSWLRTNFVATLDGAISGADGRSGSINTASDHQIFAVHRALADVIMVGAETVRTEGYRAVDLAGWQHAIRDEHGLAPFPVLAVVTGSLNLDPELARPDGPHGPVMIITSSPPEARAEAFAAAGIEVIQIDGVDGRVPLDAAVSSLVSAGLPRILCEGGPRLHRDLLAADLVDELSLTLVPTVVAGAGRRSTDGPALPGQRGFSLQHVVRADDDTVFTTYRRARHS